jgi:hypothetical protein
MRKTNRDCARKLVALAVGALLYAALPVAGQERFGEINGVVTDTSNAAVPNATMTLTNKDTSRSITVKTGGTGLLAHLLIDNAVRWMGVFSTREECADKTDRAWRKQATGSLASWRSQLEYMEIV